MSDGIELEQGALRTDMEAVLRYGASRPEAWVQARWTSDPVRIVAAFTGDLPRHEAALRQLVGHPDQLEVRWAAFSATRLEQIRAEITEMARAAEPGVFNGWGSGWTVVTVRLRADQETLAWQLLDRYGDAVELTVGLLRFPDPIQPDGADRLGCPADVERPPLIPEGEITVALAGSLEVRSGQNFHGQLVVHNGGLDDIVVMTNGQITGRVVDPGTEEAVGLFTGAQTMPLVRFAVLVGESVGIPLLGGTASPLRSLGYATPPGRWALEVVLSIEDIGAFRAPLMTITVVP